MSAPAPPAVEVSGLTVTFEPPTGSNEPSYVQPIPLSKPGIALSPTNYLPFKVAGTWTMKVDATTARGTTSGASQPFDVRTATGQLVTPPIDSSPSAPPVTPTPTTPPPPTT